MITDDEVFTNVDVFEDLAGRLGDRTEAIAKLIANFGSERIATAPANMFANRAGAYPGGFVDTNLKILRNARSSNNVSLLQCSDPVPPSCRRKLGSRLQNVVELCCRSQRSISAFAVLRMRYFLTSVERPASASIRQKSVSPPLLRHDLSLSLTSAKQ